MTEAPPSPGTHADPSAAGEPPPRPAFVRRLWMVFVQPGDLFRALARNPAWFPVAAFMALVVGASMFLLPGEAFESMWDNVPPEQRDQMPELPAGLMRAMFTGFFFVGTLIFPVLISLVTYVIFVFIRGDRATFRQHLCVNAHVGVITALGALFMVPLRMRSLDFQQTLSIGSFFRFLPEGFVASMLGGIDLFTLWACIVAGIGLAAIDERRSAKSTATILVAVLVLFAAIVALF